MQSTCFSQLVCQYVYCSRPLPSNKGKFCNLKCCNSQNALRQKAEAETRRADKQAAYEANPKSCKECLCPIPYHVILNGPAKFCSHKCAATHNNKLRPVEVYQSQAITLKERISAGEVKITLKDLTTSKKIKRVLEPKYKFTPIKWRICSVTGKPYHNKTHTGRGARQTSPYLKTYKQIYYQLARFKFNVYNMPQLFDIALLNKYGWYTCPGRKRKNSQKNINGISRDHLYAVSIGLANKVHPLLLSHPVNCRLIQHSCNKKKSTQCDITLEELIEKIKSFDNTIHRFKSHQDILDIINLNQIYLDDFEVLRKLV